MGPNAGLKEGRRNITSAYHVAVRAMIWLVGQPALETKLERNKIMTHDEMIAVIQAHKDGKVVECYDPYARKWVGWGLGGTPVFNFSTTEYRIKQQPREWVLEVHSSQDVVCAWEYPLVENAEPSHGCKFVRVREVLE